MVKIRLTRTGTKNAPSYRIVAMDSHRARDSRSLEILGFFNPSHNPALMRFKKERLNYWKSVGAKVSGAVEKIIKGKYEYVKYIGAKHTAATKAPSPETPSVSAALKE